MLLLEPIFPTSSPPRRASCWSIAVVLTHARFGAQAGHWTLVAVPPQRLQEPGGICCACPRRESDVWCALEQVTPTETAAKSHLIHATGRALTPLRPGGMAEFGGERVDVVTSGEPVEKDRRFPSFPSKAPEFWFAPPEDFPNHPIA